MACSLLWTARFETPLSDSLSAPNAFGAGRTDLEVYVPLISGDPRLSGCLRISVAVCRLFFCGLSLGFAGALTGLVVRLVSSPRCFLACAIHGFLCFSDYGLAGFFRFLAYGLGGLLCFPCQPF